MTNKMKQELINDVLCGLMFAAAFALAVPHDAMAQLSTTAGKVGSEVINPTTKIIGYGCYGIGTMFIGTGIAGCKKYADNPSSNPLNPALGRLGAGAAFVAVPSAINMLAQTSTNTLGNAGSQFNSIPGVN